MQTNPSFRLTTRVLLALMAKLPTLDWPAVYKFGDSFAAASNEPTYRLTADLMMWWLGRFVRALARGTLPEPVLVGDTIIVASGSSA